jgi:hypothetical protein
LILAKIFKYFFFPQKNSPQKPQTKVKRTREGMQTSLENKNKVATKSPGNVLKKKNRVEEGGTLGLMTHPWTP